MEYPLKFNPDASTEPGLYVHIPYCISKCSYCTFNSQIKDALESRYIDALLIEIEKTCSGVPSTIYIGGGTPTCLETDNLIKLLSGIRDHCQPESGTEWTIEANPGTVDNGICDIIAGAGVNRLSIGCQSFDDDALHTLGRKHTGAEAVNALTIAERSGIERISADLICCYPGQSSASAEMDIIKAIEAGAGHISWYELEVQSGTYLSSQVASGELHLPSEAERQAIYSGGLAKLQEQGMQRYEVANFSLSGQKCIHNLRYWYGCDYQAAGAGAVSLVNGRRDHREPDTRAYIDSIMDNGLPSVETEIIDSETRAKELFLMGLRLTDGLSSSYFKEHTGRDIQEWDQELMRLSERGLLQNYPDRMQATQLGLRFLNEILLALF